MKIRILLSAFILLPFLSKAQSNLYQKDPTAHYKKIPADYSLKNQTRKDIVMYACQFMAGCADGVNQAVVHHYLGIGNPFWDFQTSWKNKYKDYDKGDLSPAFFGAKSFAVCLTDGFHLTRTIDRTFTLGSFGIALSEKNNVKQIIKKVIISSLANRAGFLLFFNVIYPGTRG